jgi:acyl-CoA thioester hydrolase
MNERKAPSARGDFVHFETMTTRWNDNDIFGHMNNSIHYALFDSVVNRWLFEAAGRDPRTDETVGLVVHSSCDYHAELTYPHVVVAGLGVERIGTSSVTYRVALFSENGHICAAEGRFVHVYVNRSTRRPAQIDDKLRKALRGLAPEGSASPA